MAPTDLATVEPSQARLDWVKTADPREVILDQRNCQYLWIRVCQATSDTGVSGEGSGVMSTGRSRSVPLWNTAPARTSATNCGALTARHRDWADSISV